MNETNFRIILIPKLERLYAGGSSASAESNPDIYLPYIHQPVLGIRASVPVAGAGDLDVSGGFATTGVRSVARGATAAFSVLACVMWRSRLRNCWTYLINVQEHPRSQRALTAQLQSDVSPPYDFFGNRFGVK